MSLPEIAKTAALAYLLAINLLLFFVMGADKSLARHHKRRVPERTLFTLCFLGGGVGGVLGMLCFRHKTRHAQFVAGFPLILLAETALLAWLALKP
ncbi:MAG: DUF1294 domain-containing protein [Butyricicoccus sp.]|nr:DUF1294 domain-containing protein [Butyricicoccus sp.]